MRMYAASALSRNPEMWRLWAKGFSLEQIGSALGKRPSSVYRAAAACGGIAPKGRHRAAQALNLLEREEISRGIAAGLSMRRIAQGIKRSPSTISREIARNGARHDYRAQAADRAAWARAGRPKKCKLSSLPKLRLAVARTCSSCCSSHASLVRWDSTLLPSAPSCFCTPGMIMSAEALLRAANIDFEQAVGRDPRERRLRPLEVPEHRIAEGRGDVAESSRATDQHAGFRARFG